MLVVGACFFATGAAGLIYEIVWSRMLALLMGNTSYALASLLTAFMGGLALGAWIGGRLAPRGNRGLLVYGCLELGIGLYCLVLPSLIDGADPLFGWIYRNHYSSLVSFNLMQFGVVGLLLVVPTAMMGATLPILVRYLTSRTRGLSGVIGGLYALNSGGAFAGAMLAGLFLLPTLGMRSTHSVAVGVNLLVGSIALGAWWALRRQDPESTSNANEPRELESRDRDTDPVFGHGLLLIGFGVSGFAAMAYQIAWTRAVTLAIGSSTYAFTLIAGAFILGLALGSALLGWVGDRRWARYALGLVPVLIGFSALFTIARLGDLPIRVTRLLVEADDFAGLEWDKFREVLLIFLFPTLCMGGLLPIVSRFLADERSGAGRAVGSAYAANAVGTILGSFLAGFVLIPAVGMRTTIVIGGFASVSVGIAFLYPALASSRSLRFAISSALAFLFIVAVLATPRWENAVLASGPFVRATGWEGVRGDSTDERIRSRMKESELLYYAEGVSTLVTVTRQGPRISLVVGGKPDAFNFATTQNWLGHLPMFLRPDAKRVLVVGLGSGTTLGSVQSHPGVESVDSVEISAEVVFAAREFFGGFTGNALDDPRSNLIVGDGRLHLEHTDASYDVVISQPSNPWISGASSLFTEECFAAMRRRLRPGGLACIWFQGFRMPVDNFRTLCRTWSRAFGHASVWTSRIPGEFLFVGSDAPLEVDFAELLAQSRVPAVAAELERLGMTTPAHVMSYLVATDAGLAAIGAEGEVNTDDNSRIEFDTPRELFADHSGAILRLLHAERVDPWEFVRPGREDDEAYRENLRIGRRILADQYELLRALELDPEARRPILEAILQRNPADALAAAELNGITSAANEDEGP